MEIHKKSNRCQPCAGEASCGHFVAWFEIFLKNIKNRTCRSEKVYPFLNRNDSTERDGLPALSFSKMETKPYYLHCTGDVCEGDNIRFTERVFGGSYRKPTYYGDRTIYWIVKGESYGARKQQHTFTIQVLKSEGYDPIPEWKTILRKGRNVYRNGTFRQAWEDENKRKEALEEKHARGEIARECRKFGLDY